MYVNEISANVNRVGSVAGGRGLSVLRKRVRISTYNQRDDAVVKHPKRVEGGQ